MASTASRFRPPVGGGSAVVETLQTGGLVKRLSESWPPKQESPSPARRGNDTGALGSKAPAKPAKPAMSDIVRQKKKTFDGNAEQGEHRFTPSPSPSRNVKVVGAVSSPGPYADVAKEEKKAPIEKSVSGSGGFDPLQIAAVARERQRRVSETPSATLAVPAASSGRLSPTGNTGQDAYLVASGGSSSNSPSVDAASSRRAPSPSPTASSSSSNASYAFAMRFRRCKLAAVDESSPPPVPIFTKPRLHDAPARYQTSTPPVVETLVPESESQADVYEDLEELAERVRAELQRSSSQQPESDIYCNTDIADDNSTGSGYYGEVDPEEVARHQQALDGTPEKPSVKAERERKAKEAKRAKEEEKRRKEEEKQRKKDEKRQREEEKQREIERQKEEKRLKEEEKLRAKLEKKKSQLQPKEKSDTRKLSEEDDDAELMYGEVEETEEAVYQEFADVLEGSACSMAVNPDKLATTSLERSISLPDDHATTGSGRPVNAYAVKLRPAREVTEERLRSASFTVSAMQSKKPGAKRKVLDYDTAARVSSSHAAPEDEVYSYLGQVEAGTSPVRQLDERIPVTVDAGVEDLYVIAEMDAAAACDRRRGGAAHRATSDLGESVHTSVSGNATAKISSSLASVDSVGGLMSAGVDEVFSLSPRTSSVSTQNSHDSWNQRLTSAYLAYAREEVPGEFEELLYEETTQARDSPIPEENDDQQVTPGPPERALINQPISVTATSEEAAKSKGKAGKTKKLSSKEAREEERRLKLEQKKAKEDAKRQEREDRERRKSEERDAKEREKQDRLRQMKEKKKIRKEKKSKTNLTADAAPSTSVQSDEEADGEMDNVYSSAEAHKTAPSVPSSLAAVSPVPQGRVSAAFALETATRRRPSATDIAEASPVPDLEDESNYLPLLSPAQDSVVAVDEDIYEVQDSTMTMLDELTEDLYEVGDLPVSDEDDEEDNIYEIAERGQDGHQNSIPTAAVHEPESDEQSECNYIDVSDIHQQHSESEDGMDHLKPGSGSGEVVERRRSGQLKTDLYSVMSALDEIGDVDTKKFRLSTNLDVEGEMELPAPPLPMRRRIIREPPVDMANAPGYAQSSKLASSPVPPEPLPREYTRQEDNLYDVPESVEKPKQAPSFAQDGDLDDDVMDSNTPQFSPRVSPLDAEDQENLYDEVARSRTPSPVAVDGQADANDTTDGGDPLDPADLAACRPLSTITEEASSSASSTLTRRKEIVASQTQREPPRKAVSPDQIDGQHKKQKKAGLLRRTLSKETLQRAMSPPNPKENTAAVKPPKKSKKEEKEAQKLAKKLQEERNKVINLQRKYFRLTGNEEVLLVATARHTCMVGPENYLLYESGEQFDAVIMTSTPKHELPEDSWLVRRQLDGNYGYVEEINMIVPSGLYQGQEEGFSEVGIDIGGLEPTAVKTVELLDGGEGKPKAVHLYDGVCRSTVAAASDHEDGAPGQWHQQQIDPEGIPPPAGPPPLAPNTDEAQL